MKSHFLPGFLMSAMVLLLLTAAAKLVSAIGSSGILEEPDPLFGVRTRWVLVFTAMIELAAVGVICQCKDRRISSMIVAVLGAQFLWYRATVHLGGFSIECPCLGRIGEWTRIPEPVLNNTLWVMAAWIFIGGIVAFFISAARSGSNRGASYRTSLPRVSQE